MKVGSSYFTQAIQESLAHLLHISADLLLPMNNAGLHSLSYHISKLLEDFRANEHTHDILSHDTDTFYQHFHTCDNSSKYPFYRY